MCSMGERVLELNGNDPQYWGYGFRVQSWGLNEIRSDVLYRG